MERASPAIPTLNSLPREVLARIAICLDRSGINNFRLTNEVCRDVIEDPRLSVPKPWPPSNILIRRVVYPWATRRNYYFFYSLCISLDGSRVAIGRVPRSVFRRGEFLRGDTPMNVTIWDQRQGLLLELNFQSTPSVFVPINMRTKPAFSPDGDLFVVPRETGRGILIYQLPSSNRRGSVVVSSHLTDYQSISSFGFIDDNTMVFTARISFRDYAIKTCPIIRDDNGHVFLFTDPETIFSLDRQPDAVVYSEKRKIVAIAMGCYLRFYDLRRSTSAERHIGGKANDIAFSHDGNLLVVARCNSLIHGLEVFGCNVNRIEDIGHSKALPPILKKGGGFLESITFFPYSTNILARTWDFSRFSFRVIDIQSGEVLSEVSCWWNGPYWRFWDQFARDVHEGNLLALVD